MRQPRSWKLCLTLICSAIVTMNAMASTATVPVKTDATVSTTDVTKRKPISISSNPTAINTTPGSGVLQEYIEKQLGIQDNHGIRIDGAWLLDTNKLFSGGIQNPERSTSNSSLIVGLAADMQRMAGWRGGLFGLQFLQFNGQPTNVQAGTVQGYNSLPGSKPLQRSELYQLWYRQTFFDNKLIIRVGKSATTAEFNNVIKPVPLNAEQLYIPAVSGLIYTPIFINSTMLGVVPGYYNTAYGITITVAPIKEWYAIYGVFDGNLANGTQTGTKVGPTLNGSYLHIGETGFAWLLGKNHMPGHLGIGGWYQAGHIQGPPTVYENSAAGFYLFGTQRVWYRHPDIDNSGISIFYQYGIDNSEALSVKRYIGAGLTAFGLVPNRCDDSMGLGEAFSWLNQQSYPRATELMLQAYYQAKVINNIYLEPVLTYIPTPAASPNLSAAWAGTLRAIVMF